MGPVLYAWVVALVVYWTLVAALFALSLVVPVARFYARMGVATACLVFCASYGFIASLVLRLVGHGGLSQWTTARCFAIVLYLVMGISFKIEGEEHLKVRPAVFIGNHQTELDIGFLGAIFPPYCSVSAKKSLKWYPFLGWFMWASNTVFIDRSNRQASTDALAGAASQIKNQRQSVWMFPEGTRSYTAKPEMLPFKKGAFHLAVQAQVPIVPVMCANYSNILHMQTKVFGSGQIPVKVLPPIETKGLTAADVNDLVEKTRASMLATLTSITEAARKRDVAMSASTADSLKTSNAIKATGADKSGAKTRPGL